MPCFSTTIPSHACRPGYSDGLPALSSLYLDDTELAELPAGLFDDLPSLELLDLSDTELAALPDGIFERLPGLILLYLSDNPGSADFVPAADAGLDRTAAAGGAVMLDGRASLASGLWKSNVSSWNWTQVDASDNALTPPTVTLTGANTPTPSFTAPSSAGDVHLRLTVTGRGEARIAGTPTVIYQGKDVVTVTVQAATDAATDAELAGLTLAAPDGEPGYTSPCEGTRRRRVSWRGWGATRRCCPRRAKA